MMNDNFDTKFGNDVIQEIDYFNHSERKVSLKLEDLESESQINFLTFRLISLLKRQKQSNFSSKIYHELKNFYQHHKLIEAYQNSNKMTKLNTRLTTILKPNEFYYSSNNVPTYSPVSMVNEVDNKSNELYSILVSMLTAGLFVVFIMWRWVKMKSDLQRALQEQNLINQQQRMENSISRQSPPLTPVSSLTNVSPASLQNNHFFSTVNYPETLHSAIYQYNRRNRQNQKVLETAKNCLHQLKKKSVSNSRSMRSNYTIRSSINNRTIPIQIQPSIDNLYSLANRNQSSLNEAPPSYDSLMKKSSSLPSYYQLVYK